MLMNLWIIILIKQQVQSENRRQERVTATWRFLLCCSSPLASLNLLSEQFQEPLAPHTFSADMQHKVCTQQNTTTGHTVSSEYFQLISTNLRSIRSSSGRRTVNYKYDCLGTSHVTADLWLWEPPAFECSTWSEN